MNEKAEMWVSRYALSGGVKKMEGRLGFVDHTLFMCSDYSCTLRVGVDAHPTEAAAIAAAEAMRQKKIASLQKQIARLEKLTF